MNKDTTYISIIDALKMPMHVPFAVLSSPVTSSIENYCKSNDVEITNNLYCGVGTKSITLADYESWLKSIILKGLC
jgi:hypothetical protein